MDKKDGNLVSYIVIVIGLIYIVYNFDRLFDIIRKPKHINLHDLHGYYFNESVNIRKLHKNTIFVHVPSEANYRSWESFYSKKSNDLNMSIVFICILSIIESCGHKYDVVLFDNEALYTIMDTYELHDECTQVHLDTLDKERLRNWENYAKAKMLYEFGGTMMSPYFFMRSCPDSNILAPSSFRVTSYVNEGQNSTHERLLPCAEHFMSSNKHNKDLYMYLEYLKQLCLENSHFENPQFEKLHKHMKNLDLIDPKLFNIVNSYDKPIYYQDWFSSNKSLHMDASHVCSFINVPLLLKQSKYQWFLNMNIEQVKQSNTIIGQYLRHYEH